MFKNEIEMNESIEKYIYRELEEKGMYILLTVHNQEAEELEPLLKLVHNLRLNLYL